ncbi:c-type cytochrome [Oceanicoccus sagamiensis]|uniref:Cytochrome c domain-containing protein n=1 Tax=Oceanicoccus sagamiensis TaxID=716816 RepID=A0A1X9N8C0_9GAMM|nr:c-type cytochrome [Oceanicoccus sagamiensis]ARN73411.1 hypothetical protein BST96_04360 [Oceanicoccus sagamiensis]
MKKFSLLLLMAGSCYGELHSDGIDMDDISDNFDCFACHTLEDPGVGPSFKAIAQRYTAQDKTMLIDKIINGGGGNWGQEMMLAHPDINEATAASLVDFIFSTVDP